MMTIVTILLLAVVVSLDITPVTSHLTSYDCSHMTVLQYGVPIADLLPSCDTITDAETLPGEVVELSRLAVIGYRCKVTFTLSIVDVTGSKRVISNGTEVVGRDACFKAHRTKTIILDGNHIPFLQPNGTVNHTVNVDNKLVEGHVPSNHINHHYIKTYEIVLTEHVGLVNLAQNIIQFDNDNMVCDFGGYTCQDNEFGNIFWNPIHTKKYSLIYRGLITFVTVKESLTSPAYRYAVLSSKTENTAFVLLAFGNLIINEGKAFATELPNIYIVVKAGFPHNGPSGWEADKRIKSIYSVPQYAHVKAIDVGRRRCQSENLDRYVRLKSSPTFSRVMFTPMGMMGININARMGSFEVLRCEKSEVLVRKTEQCYYEIPVRDRQNSAKFLNPITRVLTDNANAIPCVEDPQTNKTEVQTYEKLSLLPEDEITVGPVESLPTELESAPSHLQSDRRPTDWMKILGLVSLGLWVSVVLVRVLHVVLGLLLTKCQKQESPNENADEVKGVKSFNMSTMADFFKPPFMGRCLKWNRRPKVGAILPEPPVTYVIY